MPFVAYEEISKKIAVSIAKVLADETLFAAIEKDASVIIRDRTGQAIPETVEARDPSLDWVVLASAWIIQYIASNHVTGQSDAAEARVKNQYAEALKILDAHPYRQDKAVTNAKPAFGCMEGLYT